MKKIVLILLFLPFLGFSQTDNPKNAFKINLSSLPFNGYGLQYEKVVFPKISLGIGANYRPKSVVPYGAFADRIIRRYGPHFSGFSFENISIENTTAGNFSITPEMRIYLGKKQAPYGTYLSIFGKANFYKLTIPSTINYTYNGAIIPIVLPADFIVNSFSGGLMLGYQAKLSRAFSVDFYVVGGHLGLSKINGLITQNLAGLTTEQKEQLRQKVIDSFQISKNYFDVQVNDTGAIISQTRKVPYVGFRMVGINLGITF